MEGDAGASRLNPNEIDDSSSSEVTAEDSAESETEDSAESEVDTEPNAEDAIEPTDRGKPFASGPRLAGRYRGSARRAGRRSRGGRLPGAALLTRTARPPHATMTRHLRPRRTVSRQRRRPIRQRWPLARRRSSTVAPELSAPRRSCTAVCLSRPIRLPTLKSRCRICARQSNATITTGRSMCWCHCASRCPTAQRKTKKRATAYG